MNPLRSACKLRFPGLGAVALGALAGLASGQSQQSLVDSTRTAMERWVEARAVIGKEQSAWQLGRELLQDRLQLVQREIDSVKARSEETAKNTADADRKKAELQAENQRLVDASSGLQQTIGGLEARAAALVKRLPEPLRERVKVLSQRFPEAGAASRLSLGERFLNVVGVLNEVNKFQREITVTSEVRALGDGTSAEVTAVYVGIGQGYYTTANGKAAGIGSSSADGWTWMPANQAAPAIQSLIKILKNEQPAAFVAMPAKVQ